VANATVTAALARLSVIVATQVERGVLGWQRKRERGGVRTHTPSVGHLVLCFSSYRGVLGWLGMASDAVRAGAGLLVWVPCRARGCVGPTAVKMPQPQPSLHACHAACYVAVCVVRSLPYGR
jgi:hypothetical protein